MLDGITLPSARKRVAGETGHLHLNFAFAIIFRDRDNGLLYGPVVVNELDLERLVERRIDQILSQLDCQLGGFEELQSPRSKLHDQVG